MNNIQNLYKKYDVSIGFITIDKIYCNYRAFIYLINFLVLPLVLNLNFL